MDDYCETCKRSFGDPGYHGVGPGAEEWKRHLDHLFPVETVLEAIEEKKAREKKLVNHCWHHSSIQHAMTNHSDVYCCECRKRRCINYASEPDPDHGPFAPKLTRRIPSPEDSEECPGRKE